MQGVRAICLVVSATLVSSAGVSAQQFRVATQNIWKGLTEFHDLEIGTRGQCYSRPDAGPPKCNSACVDSNVQSLVEHLRQVLGTGNALVGLQEVHYRAPQSCNVDQTDRLAGDLGTGWSGIFGAARPYYDGALGNGIVHNVGAPFKFTRRYTNTSPDGQGRALTIALLDFGNDRQVWFGSTHLDHSVPSVALMQAREAKNFIRHVVALYRAPAIVVGDFNLGRAQVDDCPGYRNCEAALAALMAEGGQFTEVSTDVVASHLRFSGHDVQDRQKLDYIFLHDPDDELELVRRQVIHYRAFAAPAVLPVTARSYLPCTGNRCPADHKTVVADFRFR